MFRSNNPALRADAFSPTQKWDDVMGGVANAITRERSTTMTLQGTAWKSFILLSICAAAAVIGWNLIVATPSLLLPIWGIGALVGMVLGFIVIFRPQTAPFLAPVYALAEGAFVAGASIYWTAVAAHGKAAMLGTGLVMQAGILTFGVAGCMLIAYGTRLIKPTRWMLACVSAATGGVLFFGLASVVLYMVAPGVVASFWTSPLGLIFAAVVVVVAAFNLVSDFAIVESGVANNAPKYMEWYGGFAILVTLVWLYVSLLRLLALLRRN